MNGELTLASLFDGIGGALLCAKRCGIQPVWASEIEAFPIRVTQERFPEVKHYGDVTRINGADVEPVDIVVGGSPCQDLSVAGKRAGMKHSDLGDGETTRSGLFMEQIRIIKEMRDASKLRIKRMSDSELGNGSNSNNSSRKAGICGNDGTDELIQPRYMVWENVPGAFSSNNGEDFRAVLEETARVADPTVSIPRSPQGWANAGSVLGDGFSISWRTIDAQYWGVAQRRRRIYLVADFGGQSAPKILFEREGLRGNFAESGAQGQGTAGDAEKGIRETIYSIATKQFSQNIGNNIAMTLCRDDYKEPQAVICLQGNGIDRADTAVCAPTIYESHPADSRISGPVDVCPTVTNHYHKGGADTPLVCYDMTHANDVIRECGELTPTLQNRMGTGGNQVPLVARMEAFGQYTIDGTTSAKKRRDYKDATDLVISGNVRRLTPLECERLQGYPDGWTDIPGASDSARYKALGNSFAIPCAYFVISGIKEKGGKHE